MLHFCTIIFLKQPPFPELGCSWKVEFLKCSSGISQTRHASVLQTEASRQWWYFAALYKMFALYYNIIYYFFKLV